KRAYCLKTQPATGETYPKSDLFNKAQLMLLYHQAICYAGDWLLRDAWPYLNESTGSVAS
ncbi:hypothetical protein, partial [Klebsiella variicola]|uniref:hypothetical protein n=1 Tax=Klebsiella variicola TaxID=244366 RepID=UPI001D10C6F9